MSEESDGIDAMDVFGYPYRWRVSMTQLLLFLDATSKPNQLFSTPTYPPIKMSVRFFSSLIKVFYSFGRHFCLHFEAFQLGSAPVYMAFLRFMGDDNEAKKFSYSLEVGANGRKLIWQGIPRSIRDSHRKVRDSQDGLIIQRNLALYFSGGERQELKLRITGRIWREE